jgi:hypothetical protein
MPHQHESQVTRIKKNCSKYWEMEGEIRIKVHEQQCMREAKQARKTTAQVGRRAKQQRVNKVSIQLTEMQQ